VEWSKDSMSKTETIVYSFERSNQKNNIARHMPCYEDGC